MENYKTTILLVDDKPMNIFALKELLEKEGRTFLTSNNGADALKIALNEDIDLIILDVQMPGMDGFEVAQVLKSNKRTKDIPIIFASAEKKEQQSILKGFEEGAVDYLFKPLNPEITKGKVAVFLKIQMQKKELTEKNASLEKADERIRELNADLQKNLQQLEVINKELESFSYSVSHDLRAPLRALSGYSKILEEDYEATLDEEAKRLLDNIQQSAFKMGHLIDNLLEFSRLGKKEVKKTEIDMEELVQSVVRDVNSSFKHNATIKIYDLLNASGDYSLLTQVWFNLVSNAVKYSSKKNNPLVEIGCKREANGITYYVKDNGAGFEMKYADKLFGVFQRLHSNDEFEGIGIGLAIIQRVINKQGGKVWAEAKKEEGATFYFTLPV
ncbi:MAG: response regulator [Bacteroidetes bacterium]|nr:response regulator [Bacteroidota bacterium]